MSLRCQPIWNDLSMDISTATVGFRGRLLLIVGPTYLTLILNVV